MPRNGNQVPFAQGVPGIAGVDGDMLEDAGITVAVDHATLAPVTNLLRRVPIVNAAHWLLPKMAAVKVQVPIEIKIFVAAKAGETLLLTPDMALHLGERFGWVEH